MADEKEKKDVKKEEVKEVKKDSRGEKLKPLLKEQQKAREKLEKARQDLVTITKKISEVSKGGN